MTSSELKQMRHKHKLSVPEAARVVHVSERTWQRYESGQFNVPGAIAELFAIKIGETSSPKANTRD